LDIAHSLPISCWSSSPAIYALHQRQHCRHQDDQRWLTGYIWLVVAGFLNSFIRHADVLKIANLAQIVNVIAPLMTRGDELLVQSIFYPFEMYSRRRAGVSLRPVVQGPSFESRANGLAQLIDASAILNQSQLNVFLTNRSPDEPAIVQISVEDCPIVSFDSAELVTGPDAQAANSFRTP